MQDHIFLDIPVQYKSIEVATKKISFNMASDLYTGSLLKTLVASKQHGNILELGTGSGLATSWILQGMNKDAHLTTVENNSMLLEIAKLQLNDSRIDFVLADGYQWLQNYNGQKFDLIFADAVPGKYDLFEETIALLKVGGFYIIDDMLPQSNWPEGHSEKVDDFVIMLEKRKDITLTKLNWSTGIIIATKVSDKE
ncbi:MAG TPA: class I SAM-dependent methyltransferase [Puia sp.]|jgi:predicted O-methyltransferase YrrM|nr:class I SAM-dependent methyltransferase [Puia sp.]